MIKYIAFLRGINISGKNKISMSDLKSEFEKLGFINVITVLNSGNVIFETGIDNIQSISEIIFFMLNNTFNLHIPVYVITKENLEDLINNAPNWWKDSSKEIYNNVIFLIYPTNYKEVYCKLGEPKEEYERISEYKNNIFWSYSLKDYKKTNWWSKTASENIRDKITIRTANTVKKILELCNK